MILKIWEYGHCEYLHIVVPYTGTSAPNTFVLERKTHLNSVSQTQSSVVHRSERERERSTHAGRGQSRNIHTSFHHPDRDPHRGRLRAARGGTGPAAQP